MSGQHGAGFGALLARTGRSTVRVESLIVLALLIAAMAILSPYFLSVSNFLNILLATSMIGVLAIGATYVICSAGLDLSLGSVLGFAGVVGALAVDQLGLPWPAAIPACLAAGGFCGLINGILVTRARIPAFIVTLGMLGIARGAALVLTNGQPVYGLPAELLYLGQGRPLGIPAPVLVFVGVALIAHYVLAHTTFGRYTLVIGDNEAAARATGIRVERHRVKLYVLSGTMAGIAGLLFMAQGQCRRPDRRAQLRADRDHGCDHRRHQPVRRPRQRARAPSSARSIMGVLQNGLNLLAVQSYYQQMAIGAVLILAVWLDRINAQRLQRA